MPKTKKTVVKDIPLLPLRDVVVYPGMVVPLFVGRASSVEALKVSEAHGDRIFLLAQKSSETEEPGEDDLYTYGVLATILQRLELPDGTTKVLIEGDCRAALKAMHHNNFCLNLYL